MDLIERLLARNDPLCREAAVVILQLRRIENLVRRILGVREQLADCYLVPGSLMQQLSLCLEP